ncbi:exonuclease phage-type/recb c-terminal domain-containing protein [Holotrichia oblita]|uniref:Exonuclease phage-type/recb c-terminal domain-containing protein n=1 Tax=Holotrichia oblita TaxID=644536 RepID=A0ACB9SJU4_HOLOL|nr:exonuclease phage-type/recb c-terminal domain-containing protein [Holotrichia oblita]
MESERYVLSLKNLFGYLEATPASRCIGEGEAIVNAKHIITCGILEKTSCTIDIFALCWQSSALTGKPHEIKIIFIILSNEIQVSKAVCSCKGGMSGRCKHVAAVLILCTRDDMKNLPAISSTDMKCYWKKTTFVEKYKAIPIKKHGCFIRNSLSKVKDVRVDADVLLSKLILVCPNSALAKHRIGHRIVTMETVTGEGQASILFENALNSVPLNNMPQIIPVKDCCRNIYREVCNIDILSVELETKSCKEKWFKERQFRITASRCYELYTYSLNEWEKKATKYFWPKKFCNKYVDHGVQFESAARDCYIASSNCQVIQSGLIISSQQKWLACSPDGIVFEGNTPVKLLEIKCPFEGTTSI